MKKISILLAAFLLLTISHSCSEDFFDKRPHGSTSETVFYNEQGINALILGTYGVLTSYWQVDWGASIQNWTYGSAASDDAYKGSEFGDQTPVNEIERWEVLPTNGYPAQKWRWTIGLGVNRANEVLRIINLTDDLSDAVERRLRAEARFLRALYYFEAWRVFGDRIPLLTEETPDPRLVSNANPEGAVLNFIIDDLTFAGENLPEAQSQVGRATRWAAKALAAHAYLQELKYAEAKPLLDEIINSGRFELMENYRDNYRIGLNNNKESIFEIQAAVNDGACCSANAEMGIGLNFPHGSDIGMCCGFHQPSQDLVNAFKVDADGLPMFDTYHLADLKNDMGIASDEEFVPFDDEVDPRLDWTVGRRGIPYLGWGIMRGRDWIRDQAYGGPYMPAAKPFYHRSQRDQHGDASGGWMTGVNANNYRYIRLTHVLLWRAEVAAYEGELDLARNLVNQIRERAGNEVVMGRVLIHRLPTSAYPWGYKVDENGDIRYNEEGNPVRSDHGDYLTGGTVDWSQPAANYSVGTYEQPFASNAEAMRAVQWELRLEFATEGHRFFDLRRWDKLPSGLNAFPMAETLNNFAARDRQFRPGGAMNGVTFTERDKYMPIPQNQINLQPGVLEQNPGY